MHCVLWDEYFYWTSADHQDNSKQDQESTQGIKQIMQSGVSVGLWYSNTVWRILLQSLPLCSKCFKPFLVTFTFIAMLWNIHWTRAPVSTCFIAATNYQFPHQSSCPSPPFLESPKHVTCLFHHHIFNPFCLNFHHFSFKDYSVLEV